MNCHLQTGILEQSAKTKGWRHLCHGLPAFISSGDPSLRLVVMMIAYEAILLSRLNLYGLVVSQARQSCFGTHVRTLQQGVTGIVLIALGVQLAFEQK